MSKKFKSTPTSSLGPRKPSTQDNECTAFTLWKNDETSFVGTIKDVINEVNSEKECISDIIRKVAREELQNHAKDITELI